MQGTSHFAMITVKLNVYDANSMQQNLHAGKLSVALKQHFVLIDFLAVYKAEVAIKFVSFVLVVFISILTCVCAQNTMTIINK
jgi:hypothetical protein